MKNLFLAGVFLLMAAASCTKQDKDVDPPVDNKPTLTVNLPKDVIGVNQKLLFNIQAQDKADVSIKVYARDNQGWDVKMQPDVFYCPSTAGDKILTFKAVGSAGDSTIVTKKLKVVECDFMFGLWGDSDQDIAAYEDGLKDSGFTGYWINYTGGKIFNSGKRAYYFADDKKLSKGKTTSIHTVRANDPAFVVRMLQLTDTWKTKIAELTKKYGQAISNTFPVEYDSWSQTAQIQYIQTEIDKTKAVFKDTRTEVVAQIYYYGGSNLGFNTEITFNKL